MKNLIHIVTTTESGNYETVAWFDTSDALDIFRPLIRQTFHSHGILTVVI